ncbi:MAG: hypothetical protein KAS12_06925 [Candidatus Aenigmarchaeota archaeon]|nr:hypothetical protein [Candidatus Aenigmarchaeota archaeon]
MKQYITQKQWNELNVEEKCKLTNREIEVRIEGRIKCKCTPKGNGGRWFYNLNESNDDHNWNEWLEIKYCSNCGDLLKREKKEIREIYFDDISIGDLIEFLGDKLCRMKHEIYNDDEYKLQMEIFNTKWTWIVIMYDRTFLHEELCDALWDAVKDKLKR